jgi:protein ImuB
LNLDPVTAHAFRRAGLKTIGQVAARSRAELTARFGAKLVVLLDHALGKSDKSISPRLPVPEYAAELRFADPIATQDAIAAALETLAAQLSKTMEQHGTGARRLDARFFRTDGAVRTIAVETAQPTREPGILLRLFKEKLDALADPLDPGFGYDLMRLCVSCAERAGPENAGFDARAQAERDVRFLIDRMAARFGKERVLTLQPANTHIPERTFVAVPAQEARANKLKWERMRGAGEAPRRPLRLFAKPAPIDVTAEVPDSPPLQFRWRRVLHAVAFAEGPERIAMEWWRHPGSAPEPTRDYFRVEDSEGRRFWLYREGIYHRETAAPQWFLHGIFA